jgi:hypothetical protein
VPLACSCWVYMLLICTAVWCNTRLGDAGGLYSCSPEPTLLTTTPCCTGTCWQFAVVGSRRALAAEGAALDQEIWTW